MTDLRQSKQFPSGRYFTNCKNFQLVKGKFQQFATPRCQYAGLNGCSIKCKRFRLKGYEMAGKSEHDEQVVFFKWCAVARNRGFALANKWLSDSNFDPFKSDIVGRPIVELEWIHAIPNGGARGDNKQSNQIRGAALIAEGVRAGVADIFLPLPVDQWHGLYIEMKKESLRPKREGSKGGVSEDQQKFGDWVLLVNYGWIVAYGARHAAEIVQQYIEWGERS